MTEWIWEDRTLIKEADNVRFVIDRSDGNTFTNSSKPTKWFLEYVLNTVLTHTIKEKSAPSVSTPKWLNSSQEQCAKC